MEEGRYMQQDAEEFFNILSQEIAQGLSMFRNSNSSTSTTGSSTSANSVVSTFDSLLSLQLEGKRMMHLVFMKFHHWMKLL